jgi:hypothetical protein
MLGFGQRQQAMAVNDSKLPIYVQVVQDAGTFALAQKAWQNNERGVRLDPGTRKEFLRFELLQPAQVVWLQRDQNRTDVFEMILVWGEGERFADVYVLSVGNLPPKEGDPTHLGNLLQGILALPSTVPLKQKRGM